jgi:autonomous glycyl radical cofactor GrcA
MIKIQPDMVVEGRDHLFVAVVRVREKNEKPVW